MGEPAINVVAGDARWQRRVQQEYKHHKDWDSQWGFMRINEGDRLQTGVQLRDSLDVFADTRNQNLGRHTNAIRQRRKNADFRRSLEQMDMERKMQEQQRRSQPPWELSAAREAEAIDAFVLNVQKKYQLVPRNYSNARIESNRYGRVGNLEKFGKLNLHMR
mmetsp:Transcript_6627/g.13444  ORF Transcript_6627/g.13444 Transcript_6627/m.13444 type:complete len:162 (-) Transcript_6627:78-563(-)|eukprot:CAMPEP_0118957622 /NCGR_PEP_ID=MMETSP1169-20130426/62202_1 /TAXON_ID=36882 /ORGANISM="Pyramimonas obovata, Strain CCMP722" /LENGTH=161 /DNA_ID=CAMNT_0006905711 /DNA_START=752 /DNA_END=1237 /DNA_ORIENTATION=-